MSPPSISLLAFLLLAVGAASDSSSPASVYLAFNQAWWCDASSTSQAFKRTPAVNGSFLIESAAVSGACIASNDGMTSTILTQCDDTDVSQMWLLSASGSGRLDAPPSGEGTSVTISTLTGSNCWNMQGGPGIVVLNSTVALYPCAATPSVEWNDLFTLDYPFAGAISINATSGSNATWPGMCVQSIVVAAPTPTPEVNAWMEREIACFVHFNMATEAGSQGCGGGVPPPIATWNPSALDTDSWISTGVALGCKRFVYTAKHGCGFIAWDSKVTSFGYNYSAPYAAAPYNSPEFDVVSRFVASGRAAGVGVGFYYSVVSNAYTNVNNGVVGPNPAPGQLNVTEAQYNQIVVQHLSELWGNYGALEEVWFDGGVQASLDPAIKQLFATLQPNIVAFQAVGLMPSPVRWVGTESGYAPDPTWSAADADGNGDPNGPIWYPAETDFTLQNGDHWFYSSSVGVHPPAELRAMYEASAGHNTAIIVDIAPMPNGTVPAEQVAAATTMGQYITQCYDAPAVAGPINGTGLVFTLTVAGGPAAIDRVVMQEDQRGGQNIRAYTVTATLADGSTVTLSSGTSVGNKKIDVLSPPVTVSSVTMNVTSTIATPTLRGFAVRSCDGIAAALDAAWDASDVGRENAAKMAQYAASGGEQTAAERWTPPWRGRRA